METEEENKVQEDNKKLVYKNISYEMDTNKLMVNDSNNNHYLCDIYGRKTIKFLPYISGRLNRYKQQNFLKDKNLSLRQSSNISPKHITPTKNINYYPTIRRFEGYSKFPRPIAPPLGNIPNYTIKEKDKRKIIEELNTYFNEKSAKKDILRKNENKGISYITGEVNDCDLIKHDTEQSLKLIQNTLNTFREEYKLKLNIMNKDAKVKALYQFRKKLFLNKDAKTINGRELADPPEKFKKNYKIIHSMVRRTGLSHDKQEDKDDKIFTQLFNKIKYTRNNKTSKKLDGNKFNLKNISIITGPDRLNDLYKTKDFTVGRLINLEFGQEFPENNKTEANDNIDEKKFPENENIPTQNNESNKIEEAYKETEETLNGGNNMNINLKTSEDISNKDIFLEEKKNKKDNELSFISYMTENEKKYEKENIVNIKTKKKMDRLVEHNNRLLLGYQEKERAPETLYPKSRILKLKSNGELYLENINLLRKTNKEAFKLQEQKELYDLKMLEKKIRISTINANNVLKGKVLKVNKTESNDDD